MKRTLVEVRWKDVGHDGEVLEVGRDLSPEAVELLGDGRQLAQHFRPLALGLCAGAVLQLLHRRLHQHRLPPHPQQRIPHFLGHL